MNYLHNPSPELQRENDIIDMRIVNFFGKYGINPNLLVVDSDIDQLLQTDRWNYKVYAGNKHYRGMLVKVSKDTGLYVGLY